jgi:CHAD domain-containing protein
MNGNREREFRLRATSPIEVAAIDAALREAGLQCTSTESTTQVDTYLDDEAGRLAGAGVGLRQRADHRGRTLCCKYGSSRDGALFVRTEIEEPWPTEALPEDAAGLPLSLRDAVEPILLGSRLSPVLMLEIQRETRHLAADGKPVATVAIDRVTTSTGPQRQQFLEVEIEVLDEPTVCERLADRLAATLPVFAAADDKPTHAAGLLGRAVERADRPEFGAVPPTTPIAAAIDAATQRQFAAMQAAEAGVRSSKEPEHLHTMRVALRRLRSLVRAFRTQWPEATSRLLLTGFAETAQRLGRVRELDVVLASMPKMLARLPAGLRSDAELAAAWLANQRAAEHAALLTWLRDPARLASTRRLRDALSIPAASPATDAAVPFGPVAAARLARTASTLRRLARSLPPELPLEPLHKLRIACKRLRYLGEEFRNLPGLLLDKPLTMLDRLQRTLGRVCDHEAAASRLVGWLPLLLPEVPNAGAAVGGLAMGYHTAAQRARNRARKHLRKVVRKKPWRAFKQAQQQDAKLAP